MPPSSFPVPLAAGSRACSDESAWPPFRPALALSGRSRRARGSRSAASPPWAARGKEYNRGWPTNSKPYAARVADGPTLVSEDAAGPAPRGPAVVLVRHARSVQNDEKRAREKRRRGA